MNKIVTKTLGNAGKELDQLGKCNNAAAGDPDNGCGVSVVRDSATAFTDNFGDDHRCARAADPATGSGFLPVTTLSNGNDFEQVCQSTWGEIDSTRLKGNAGYVPKYRSWHRMSLRGLTAFEKGLWGTLGLATAYMEGTGSTWQTFTRKVVVEASRPWSQLTADQKQAASSLRFTGETWGNQWALLDRIHRKVSHLIAWDTNELSSKEMASLGALGWNESNWEDVDASPQGTSVAWDSLTPDQQAAARQLRITDVHWERVRSETTRVSGCFWHYGTFASTHGKFIADPAAPKASINRRRRAEYSSGGTAVPDDGLHSTRGRRRAAGNASSALACPPGHRSNQTGLFEFECVACAPGQFKSVDMALSRICVPKMGSCDGEADRTYMAGDIFGSESTIEDDTMCAPTLPQFTCPAGTFRVDLQITANNNFKHGCARCPSGTISHGPNTRTSCTLKATVECPPGKYVAYGESTTHDDRMCVACPSGTFQNMTLTPAGVGAPAEVATQHACKAKAVPLSCPAGTHLVLGTSSMFDDNACTACPLGTHTASANLKTACADKTVNMCPPGKYFYTTGSRVVDDNVCLTCPTGTFSNDMSAAEVCLPKAPLACTATNSYLHKGTSLKQNDNACVASGLCAVGHYKTVPGATCEPCPEGTHRSTSSDKTACDIKQVEPECPAGTQLEFGVSIMEDDAYCGVCMRGTYSAVPAGRCLLKNPHVMECPAGKRVSSFASTTSDDSSCQACNPGQFTNDTTARTACDRKVAPVNCPAGRSISQGTSATEDDWNCSPCANGTFTSAVNSKLSCTKKTDQADCDAESEVLRLSNSATEDSTCIVPGRCGPGFQVANNGVDCAACKSGTFSPSFTTSKAACQNKTRVASCAPGRTLSTPGSASRDDWKCTICALGKYQGLLNLIKWSDNGTVVDRSELACTDKTAVADCVEPGTEFSRGNSAVDNDWGCYPRPETVTLCKRDYSFNTRSTLTGLRAGMPRQVLPFTAWYEASLRVPGQDKVTSKVHVAIIGERYESDAERVAFPQSRPLLVLHDPPGGNSFSAFANEDVAITTRDTDHQTERWVGLGASGEFGGGLATEISIDAQLSPMGLGVGTEITTVNTEWLIKGAVDTNVKTLAGGSAETTSDATNKIYLAFTYQTSPDPDKAGPASDAFLVPAVWFDVIRVWKVGYGNCNLFGMPGTTLKANADLSGFAFVTTNDAETRALPTLREQMSYVAYRKRCIAEKICCRGNLPEDDNYYTDDVSLGCQANDLAGYCDFVHLVQSPADRKKSGWRDCLNVYENIDKAKCKNKRNGGCRFDRTPLRANTAVAADTVEQYCTQLVALYPTATAEEQESNALLGRPNTVAECTEFEDSLAAVNAYKDWAFVLDRNYKHHEKARNKDSVVRYPRYEGCVDCSSVEIEPLAGVAPNVLIGAGKRFNGEALSSADKATYKGWNVISFVGGGSVVEFSTNQFDSSLGTPSALEGSYSHADHKDGRSAWVTESSISAGFDYEAMVTVAGVGTKTVGGTTRSVNIETSYDSSVHLTTEVSSDSSGLYHLEDGDGGDCEFHRCVPLPRLLHGIVLVARLQGLVEVYM